MTIFINLPELSSRDRSMIRLGIAGLRQQPCILTYSDADGVVSTRRIIPPVDGVTLCQNGERVIYAHDLNRRSVRCFRLDRIVHVGLDR